MQQYQGFPKLNTTVRILNKLNNMALTVSDGWHDTKANSVIIDKPIQADKQKFQISQKQNLKVYFIQPLHKDVYLSTKSGWGDMVYSQVKIEKYSQDTNLLWRIVPYDQVVYCEKSQNEKKLQQKNTFQINNEVKTSNKSQPQQTSSQITETKVQQKTGHVTRSFFKLGYEFESGPQVQTYTQAKTSSKNQNVPPVSKPIESKYDIANPPRFPIKQKNNLEPIDLDNKGWFFIQNVKFNLVLQVEGGIDEPGISIVLNRLNGNRNQLWRFQ